MFTDGYPDQFGGEKGKKFKYSNFEKQLIQIAHLSMAEQKLRLDTIFENWKSGYEQTDDVCVIGVKF
jgi:serine phosphatase RsbU (regulator of sigma subunit)